MDSENMLVTGGTGVIGSWVCSELLEQGVVPVVYDLRPDFSLLERIRDKIRFVQGDIQDKDSLEKTIKTLAIQKLIHLAAIVPPSSEEHFFEAFKVNVNGSLNIFEAARVCNCRRVVYASSRSVFGQLPDRFKSPTFSPIKESERPSPVSVYGTSKLMVEHLANVYVRRCGCEMIGFRFPGMYGPGRLLRHKTFSFVSRIIEAAHEGGEILLPVMKDEGDDILYVKDASRIIALTALKSNINSGIYHIGSGEIAKISDITRILENHCPNVRFTSVEKGGLESNTGTNTCLLDFEKAKQDLGYEPKFSLQKGIIDFLQFLDKA